MEQCILSRNKTDLVVSENKLRKEKYPTVLIIKFDDGEIGSKMQDEDGWVAITPAVPSRCTSHKALDKAVVDLGMKNFAEGQVYIGLSRLETLEGIALCDWESNILLSIPHYERASSEMMRLRSTTSFSNWHIFTDLNIPVLDHKHLLIRITHIPIYTRIYRWKVPLSVSVIQSQFGLDHN